MSQSLPLSYSPMLGAARGFIVDFARFSGRRGLAVLGWSALAALCDGLGLTLLIPILGLAADGAPQGWVREAADRLFAAAGLADRDTRLVVLLAGFLALLVIRGLVVRARDIGQTALQTGFIQQQRRDLINGLARARWSVIERLRHGRVAQAMSADTMRVAAASIFAIQAAIASVAVLVQAGLAFTLSPALTLTAAVFAGVGLLTLAPWLRRVFATGESFVDLQGRVMDALGQFLGGLKLAVGQNLQGGYVQRVEALLAQLRDGQIDFARRQSGRRMAGSMVAGLIGVLIAFVGLRVLHIQPLVLLAVLALLARAAGPLVQIQQSAQAFIQALPAYRQVRTLYEELAAEAVPAAPKGEPPVWARRAAISIRGLSYARGDTPVLEGLALDLPPGAFVGLTGDSGAGKTTLADLLVGLLPPQSGEILVGGHRLVDDHLPAWRDHVAYVSQDPFLFHDTVRANLLWGAAENTDERDLWRALARTGAEELVRRLPRGLDTLIGERGVLVSGGERQRLALSRALLRQPDLLILDEATNAIDIDAEAKILAELRDLAPRPTILLIAHRRESFQVCDQVLRLQAGALRPDTALGAAAA